MLFAGDPRAAQTVLFWLLGSFGSANWTQLPLPAAVLVVCMVPLLASSRSLNALALGPDVAASVGVDVPRLRRRLFVLISLLAGVAVAVLGLIGFVGLVSPQEMPMGVITAFIGAPTLIWLIRHRPQLYGGTA